MARKPSLEKIRRLSIALIISGACNIFLTAFILYSLFKEVSPRPYYEKKPAEQTEKALPLAAQSNTLEVIRELKTLTLKQLIDKLSDTELVENGYSKRDLALASLVAFHHFDLFKALGNPAHPIQKRFITFGKTKEGQSIKMIIYPGLSDEEYRSIIAFAATEQWPLTSRGLFLEISKKKPPHPSAVEAFYLTPEFLAVETLFSRANASIGKEALLQLVAESPWPLLFTFFEQQRASQDLSPARRQRFLIDYINQKSNIAAELILKTDGEFALNKLDDDHVLSLLSLLTKKTQESEHFALHLLTRPRSDKVWQLAAKRLFEYAGEPLPEKSLHHAALLRFVPKASIILEKEPPNAPLALIDPPKTKAEQKTITPQNSSPKKNSSCIYTVQEGDSLWKIARRFSVDVLRLKAYNQLESDRLKPGTSLKIPPSSSAKQG